MDLCELSCQSRLSLRERILDLSRSDWETPTQDLCHQRISRPSKSVEQFSLLNHLKEPKRSNCRNHTQGVCNHTLNVGHRTIPTVTITRKARRMPSSPKLPVFRAV